MKRLRAWLWLGFVACGLAGLAVGAGAQPSGRPVVEVPIHGMVDDGMAHLVQRSIALANAEHARAVVLEVNSSGGLVEAALRIKDAIFSANEPVIAYVSDRAFSSASLISLASNRIVMAPGAAIGSAEPHPNSKEATSALRAEFESTAIRNHRNPVLAGAMVDPSIPVPQYKETGGYLNLTANDALKAGIADAIEPTLGDALSEEHLSGAPVIRAHYSWGEELARIVNTPVLSGMLLTIGLLGFILEMQTMHGIAGAIGVTALALFFGTHIYAGFSDWLVIALAIAGAIGVLWELHVVPGHGVPGILGGVALLFAVLLAFGIPFFFVGIETVATAIVLAVAAFAVFTRVFPHNAWMNRLALAAAQGPEYVSSADFSALRGATGTANSYLRPVGIASIDGVRVDVLTEGEFIPSGTPIRVTRVEGARIFVEPLSTPELK
jgi:membrane-bound serine protease (ClpP class)